MRFPKFRYVVLAGAALGGIAPLLFFISHRFQDYVAGGKGIFLWPSGMLLMGTAGREHDPDMWLAIAISILPNLFLYAAIAALIWSVFWIIRRVATRTP